MIYLFSYYFITSIVSFVLFGIDKRKANNQQRRISEKNLLRSVGLGGRIGGVIGMTYFHHKTIKSSFLWKFWVLVVVRVAITIIGLFTLPIGE